VPSKVLSALLALLAAALLAACGSGGGSSGATSAAGRLIISRATDIVERDIATGRERTLVSAGDAGEFVFDAALSPDGARIVYVRQPPAKVVEGRYDAGSDLWLASRDGGGARAIFTHSDPNQIVRFPRWLDDRTVLAVIQEVTDVGGRSDLAYTLQRIDVESGARARIALDVLSFDISPDRTRVVYAMPVSQTGQALASVGLDGSDPRTLIPAEANLSPFNYPRFSPDGSRIAFATADQALAPVIPGATPPGGVVPARLAAPLPNGLPEDLYLLPAAGGEPQLLAALQEDVPSLSWSADGSRIYVQGSVALYEVDAASGAITQVGPGVFHGQVDWAP
jgi:dipeptidyl aminopeptidase/acylaminoacyl peptidase